MLVAVGCDHDDRANDPGPPLHTPITEPGDEAIVIGLVGSLTGADEWRGEDAFEGADLAVSILNRSREEDELPFVLVTLDDQGDRGRATELVRELAADEMTVGIVYAGPPEALPPAEGALARAGIPAILSYGDLYGARKLSPHVFQVSPSFVWEARRIAAYVLRDRRYTRIGALVTAGTLSGRTAARALREALSDQGARRPIVTRYSPGEARSTRSALEALRRRGAQAVVVEGPPQGAAGVVAALKAMNAAYRTTATARAPRSTRVWRPQLIGFDLMIGPRTGSPPAGTVASDTYARGAHYLPVPSFNSFLSDYVNWWGATKPLGWQLRSFDAVRMIGWAAERAGVEDVRTGRDLALVLERLNDKRWGGLDITLGPDDHTAVDQTSLGLWVVPSRGRDVYERSRIPRDLVWVPLARTFSTDGKRTDIEAKDWRYLFTNPPPPKAPRPKFSRMRFGVTTPRSDPVH